MTTIWLAAALSAVIIIIVILFIIYKAKPIEIDSNVTTPSPSLPPVPISTKVYGISCISGDMCTGDISSARPNSSLGIQRSSYVGTSITTDGHPFIVGKQGPYVPNPSWWVLSSMYGCCLGFRKREVFFLTENGLYAVDDNSILLLSDPINSNGVSIKSVHRYDGVLYALIDDKLVHLVSESVYNHTYSSVVQSADVQDVRHLSTSWQWAVMEQIRGRDIASTVIKSITVVTYGKKNDALYIHSTEEIMKYHNRRWMTVKRVLREGHCLTTKTGKMVVMDKQNTIVTEARGIIGVITGKIPILYTIDRESWMWVSSVDSGYIPAKKTRGWTALHQLEDGSIISVSSGETYIF